MHHLAKRMTVQQPSGGCNAPCSRQHSCLCCCCSCSQCKIRHQYRRSAKGGRSLSATDMAGMCLHSSNEPPSNLLSCHNSIIDSQPRDSASSACCVKPAPHAGMTARSLHAALQCTHHCLTIDVLGAEAHHGSSVATLLHHSLFLDLLLLSNKGLQGRQSSALMTCSPHHGGTAVHQV